jgi:hypothetical protein
MAYDSFVTVSQEVTLELGPGVMPPLAVLNSVLRIDPTLYGAFMATWMATLPLSASGVAAYGWWNNGGLPEQVLP